MILLVQNSSVAAISKVLGFGSQAKGNLFLATVLGALTVFAFAPFNAFYLPFISLSVLFYLWQDASPKFSFCLGFAFGLGMYCFGVSWVYVSLSTYGGMPLWMGSIAVIGFASLPALTIALAGFASAVLVPTGGFSRLFSMPIFWVVGEWTKSWFLTGFPWLDLGYTQTPTWLFAFAPIGGVYFISAIIALACVCIVAIFAHQKRVIPTIGVFVLIGLSAWANTLQWSTAIGEPLQVGIAQGNVPIGRKWQPEYQNRVISELRSLNQTINAEQKADLIVWPETALPLYLEQTDNTFWRSIISPKTALLTGILDSERLEDSKATQLNRIYNAAVLQCGAQHDFQQQVYRKRHLVPFGEFLPFRFLFNWVLEYLQLPMSDFSAWQGQQALQCGEKINIGLSICYEDAFAAEVNNHVGSASVLVNISEDAWFGDSFAPHQRLQMGQMRARELARPMVRSANSGPSSFLNERGEILSQTKQFEVAILTQVVQPQTGDTVFKRFGNWIVIVCFLSILILLVKRIRVS